MEFSKEMESFCQEMSLVGMKTSSTKILKSLSKLENKKETTLEGEEEEEMVSNTDEWILSFTPKEIAQQLTLITFDYFKKLKPSEFLNQHWTKKTKEVKAPNLTSLINRSNEIAAWVATIIMNEKMEKERVIRMEKMIDVANESALLHNYNLTLEILSGLRCNAINRLKKTKMNISELHQMKFKELEKISDPYKSFKNLREMIKEQPPPCIPYIGMYCTDLMFIEDGNPNQIGELINWTKRRLYAQVIRQIQVYQLNDFREIKKMNSMKRYLLDLKNYSRSMDALYEESLMVEPKEIKKKKNKEEEESPLPLPQPVVESSLSLPVVESPLLQVVESSSILPVESTMVQVMESSPNTHVETHVHLEKKKNRFIDSTIEPLDCSSMDLDSFLDALDQVQEEYSDFIGEWMEKEETMVLEENGRIGDLVRKRIFPLIEHSLKVGLHEKYHVYDYASMACKKPFGEVLSRVERYASEFHLMDKNEENMKRVRMRMLLAYIFK
jgi:hypothetical protein